MNGIVLPVYHPAAALRSTEMMNVLREDFKKIPAVLAGELGAELPPAIESKVTADPFVADRKGEKEGPSAVPAGTLLIFGSLGFGTYY